MAKRLTAKQQSFVEQYVSGADGVRFNATQSYIAAYGCQYETAKASSYRLLENDHIKAAIFQYREAAREAARSSMVIDAQWVLEKSVLYYEQCVGIEPIPKAVRVDGEWVTEYVREHNQQGAKNALDLIGKNVIVQAFQANSEVTHVHKLEELLTRRTKVIEGQAGVTDDRGVSGQIESPSDAPAIEHGTISASQDSKVRT